MTECDQYWVQEYVMWWHCFYVYSHKNKLHPSRSSLISLFFKYSHGVTAPVNKGDNLMFQSENIEIGCVCFYVCVPICVFVCLSETKSAIFSFNCEFSMLKPFYV